MKTILIYLAIGFVIWFIVTSPGNAAGEVHSAIHGLNRIATGFGNFVSSL